MTLVHKEWFKVYQAIVAELHAKNNGSRISSLIGASEYTLPRLRVVIRGSTAAGERFMGGQGGRRRGTGGHLTFRRKAVHLPPRPVTDDCHGGPRDRHLPPSPLLGTRSARIVTVTLPSK